MGNPDEGNQYKYEKKANPRAGHSSRITYAIHQQRKMAGFPFFSNWH